MTSLYGKTAIITGSGRGIGRGIALALASQGCNIVINFFRNRKTAEETVAAAQAIGVRAIAVKANVGREDEIARLVDESIHHFGRLDIFVGNAASGVQRPLLDVDVRAWDWTLNINARSILAGIQAVAPMMKMNGWGRVLTLSSIGGRRVLPDYGIVGVSKSAIETITRYLAVELAPYGITVNCISPGVVRTRALDFFPQGEEMISHAEQHTPAGRLVTPEDVGELAAWLCSDHAAMITGQTIDIDGGYSLLMKG